MHSKTSHCFRSVILHRIQTLYPKTRIRDMAYLHAQSTTCQGKKPSATHTLDPNSQGFQQHDIGFLGCRDNPAARTGLSAAQHSVFGVRGQPCSLNWSWLQSVVASDSKWHTHLAIPWPQKLWTCWAITQTQSCHT